MKTINLTELELKVLRQDINGDFSEFDATEEELKAMVQVLAKAETLMEELDEICPDDGDGNENAAIAYSVGSSPISGTSGKLEYNQLVEFWAQFDPYTMNTLLCSTPTMTAMLKIPELQNPLTGLNFQGTGKLSTPLGAQLCRSSVVDDNVIIGLDNRYALEQVRAGDVMVEFDKIIDRQLERAAISTISGFAKICDGASCVLNV